MIVKRAVKGRIRMELRIREVDKGGAAKVTNTREAGPFGKHRGLVILVRSVSLSNWPLLVAQRPDLRVTKVNPSANSEAGFPCTVS